MATPNRSEVINLFERFYESAYRDAVENLVDNYPDEQRSLRVNWTELNAFDETVASAYLETPTRYRELAEEALRRYARSRDGTVEEAHVRIAGVPNEVELAAIRSTHQGRLVNVSGVVQRVSPVRRRPTEVTLECHRCEDRYTFSNSLLSEDLPMPPMCRTCEYCGPFHVVEEESSYLNIQLLELVSSFLTADASDSRRLVALARNDLIERVTVGDHVSLTGVLRLSTSSMNAEAPVADRYIEIHSMVGTGGSKYTLSDDDKRAMLDLCQSSDVFEQFKDRIAPNLYGLDHPRLAALLQSFGGVPKALPDGDRIRGAIHVLVVGEPAVGKSRLLGNMADLAPRASRWSGTSIPEAGLTATVVTDEATPFEIEAGVLAMTDWGVTCIDDFEAMDDVDEMELAAVLGSQRISVSEATTTDSIPARSPVLAAAEPRHGRFDAEKPLGRQLAVRPSLLHHFDLIIGIQDQPDRDRDERVADTILTVNSDSAHQTPNEATSGLAASTTDDRGPEAQSLSISKDLFRKYICYAKQHCQPTMTDAAKTAVKEFYVDARSARDARETVTPVTPLTIESIIRLAEASARVRLSDQVTCSDVERVTDLASHTLGYPDLA